MKYFDYILKGLQGTLITNNDKVWEYYRSPDNLYYTRRKGTLNWISPQGKALTAIQNLFTTANPSKLLTVDLTNVNIPLDTSTTLIPVTASDSTSQVVPSDSTIVNPTPIVPVPAVNDTAPVIKPVLPVVTTPVKTTAPVLNDTPVETTTPVLTTVPTTNLNSSTNTRTRRQLRNTLNTSGGVTRGVRMKNLPSISVHKGNSVAIPLNTYTDDNREGSDKLAEGRGDEIYNQNVNYNFNLSHDNITSLRRDISLHLNDDTQDVSITGGTLDSAEYYIYGKGHKDWNDRPTDPKTTECATFVTNDNVTNGRMDSNNVRGNAWEMLQRMKEKGVEPVWNIYENWDVENPTKDLTIDFVRQMSLTDEYKQTVMDSLKPGAIVTLLYPGSGHYSRSGGYDRNYSINNQSRNTDRATRNFSTHVGQIVMKDGKYYVQDNFGEKIHYRPVESLLNHNDKHGLIITGVAHPGELYVRSEQNVGVDTTSVGRKISKKAREDGLALNNLYSKNAYRALSAIDANQKLIQREYGLSDEDFEELKKMTDATIFRESGYGLSTLAGGTKDNGAFNYKHYRSKSGKRMLGVAELADEIGIRDKSRTLGNVKLQLYFTEAELRAKGYREVLDLQEDNPEVSGLITFEALAKLQGKIYSLLPEELLSDRELVEALTMSAFNLGLKNPTINIQRYKDAVASGKKAKIKKELDALNSYKSFSIFNKYKTISGYSDYSSKDIYGSEGYTYTAKPGDYHNQPGMMEEFVVTAPRVLKKHGGIINYLDYTD